jgi:hypothetical protein
MNVTLMPSIPLKTMPQSGIINPEKSIKKIGIQGTSEEFKNQLADLKGNVSEINSSSSKTISFDQDYTSQNGEDRKKALSKNILLENLNGPENTNENDLKELGQKPDLLSKLPSNELFLFQRDLANKIGGKNDSIHSFSKVFNLEKKDKKTDIQDGGENIGNIVNNNKNLEGIIKDNQATEGSLKFTSPKELFNWISKVISKNQIKNGESLNLQIRDNNLGQFNISAQNAAKGGEINMSIVSQTKESDEFFKTNEKDLIKSLEAAGVKIGKIEILTAESSKPSSNSDNMSENKGSLSDSINNHFDQKEQLEKDSQRRKDIWNRFRDIRES